MSTLLSDLESGGPSGGGGDEDLVAKIMMEMGGGGGGGGGSGGGFQPPQNTSPQIPSAMPPGIYGAGSAAPGGVMNAPSNQMAPPQIMDSMPPTAHMIGGSHPTPADFAAAMGGSPSAAWGGGDAGSGAPVDQMQQPRYVVSTGSKRQSWISRIVSEFKTPLIVTILVFAFSLPVVNFLFAHYLPRFVKPTGELTPIGLLLKSVAAGATFWLLNSVLVPLLRV